MRIRAPEAEKVHVRRPWLVVLLAGLAASAGAAALFGMLNLSQAMEARPVTVAYEGDQLSDALAEAPWTDLGGEGPIVWVVSEAACPRCRDFHTRQLDAIAEAGVRVRMIVVAPRAERDAAELALTAEIARRRDPAQLAVLLRDRRPPPPPSMEPAEQEGHLEWGRASLDRIAAVAALNGRRLTLPAIFWRRGGDWRASFGRDPNVAAHIDRDLAPGV